MRCLSIHLTDLCNSECTFCVVGSPLYTRNTVDYDDVLRFLRENADRGYDVVNLHGGEPTVHPQFDETLIAIQDLGYPEVHLQTNGIRLADPVLLDRWIKLGLRKCIVSLHGSTAAMHDGQTHSRGFEKTIAAMGEIKRRGLPIRTNTVITRQNLFDLAPIAQLACDLGVDHLNFSALHPVGSARLSRGQVMPSATETMPPLRAAIAIAREAARVVTLEGFPYCAADPDMLDLHLHNEYRDIKLLVRGVELTNYDDFMRDDMRVFGDACSDCGVRERCGGVYPEYAEYYGWAEVSPLNGAGERSALHVIG